MLNFSCQWGSDIKPWTRPRGLGGRQNWPSWWETLPALWSTPGRGATCKMKTEKLPATLRVRILLWDTFLLHPVRPAWSRPSFKKGSIKIPLKTFHVFALKVIEAEQNPPTSFRLFLCFKSRLLHSYFFLTRPWASFVLNLQRNWVTHAIRNFGPFHMQNGNQIPAWQSNFTSTTS